MKVLLDTCVLSEIQQPAGSQSVKSVVAAVPDEQLFVSVLTLGEINKGIDLLPVSKKREDLERWINGLQSEFSARTVPVDLETAVLWGRLTARMQKNGTILPAIDGLLAATAIRHSMQLMTRNSRHFKDTGVMLWDPWS